MIYRLVIEINRVYFILCLFTIHFKKVTVIQAPSVMSHVSSLHDELIQSYEQMSVTGAGPNMALLGDVNKSCDAARGLVDLFADTDLVRFIFEFPAIF